MKAFIKKVTMKRTTNTRHNIEETSNTRDEANVPRCPFHDQARLNAATRAKAGPPLDTSKIQRLTYDSSGSFAASQMSANLLDSIGGPPRVMELFNVFYEKAFQDKVLDTFIRSHDDPHGLRLGAWVIEKMTGDPIWSSRRPDHARQRAHSEAWYCEKRPVALQGRHFKVDDCRIWMRLMFWAARECGLFDPHYAAFIKWYIMFISHFIAVYERSAPPHTQESADWSANPENIEAYLRNGRIMVDILGSATAREFGL